MHCVLGPQLKGPMALQRGKPRQLVRFRGQTHSEGCPLAALPLPPPQISEPVFQAVLFSVLQADFSSAFSTPEQLQLLLVGLQRFPDVLQPKKLKKLLGSAAIVTKETVPRCDWVWGEHGSAWQGDRAAWCQMAWGSSWVKLARLERAYLSDGGPVGV